MPGPPGTQFRGATDPSGLWLRGVRSLCLLCAEKS